MYFIFFLSRTQVSTTRQNIWLRKNSSIGFKKKGFTIIEVLLALALIGLIAGLFAANFDLLLRAIQKVPPEEELYNAIREAKYQAIQQHEPMYLSYDKENRAFLIHKKGGESQPIILPSSHEFELNVEVIPSMALGRTGTRSVKRLVSKENEILFYPDGSSTPVVVILSEEGGQSIKMKVDPFSGGVTLFEGS